MSKRGSGKPSCPECGKAATGNFCEHCGANLGGRFCNQCGAEIAPKAKFCNQCGEGAAGGAAPGDAHRAAAAAAKAKHEGPLRRLDEVAYLRFAHDRNVPGMVVVTLAQEISRVLVPVNGESAVRGRHASVLREVAGAVTLKGTATIRDRYARNLLYGLMPDGYLNSTPKQVLGFFHSHWKKLDLDRIELDEPAKPAGKGKK